MADNACRTNRPAMSAPSPRWEGAARDCPLLPRRRPEPPNATPREKIVGMSVRPARSGSPAAGATSEWLGLQEPSAMRVIKPGRQEAGFAHRYRRPRSLGSFSPLAGAPGRVARLGRVAEIGLRPARLRRPAAGATPRQWAAQTLSATRTTRSSAAPQSTERARTTADGEARQRRIHAPSARPGRDVVECLRPLRMTTPGWHCGTPAGRSMTPPSAWWGANEVCSLPERSAARGAAVDRRRNAALEVAQAARLRTLCAIVACGVATHALADAGSSIAGHSRAGGPSSPAAILRPRPAISGSGACRAFCRTPASSRDRIGGVVGPVRLPQGGTGARADSRRTLPRTRSHVRLIGRPAPSMRPRRPRSRTGGAR